VTRAVVQVPASFRDPSGFVFNRNGSLYRQVNLVYRKHYDHLVDSGLYDALVNAELLVPHEEVGREFALSPDAYRVLRPRTVPFISYPYEWCFSQLRDAALTTLRIQKMALSYDMTLKDGSAYNIQFYKGKPIFIDTLSFDVYEEGKPWVAYRQFCEHFLAPLSLMSYRDIRLGQLSRVHLDGVPLDLASALLPWRTRIRPALFLHVHMHAKSQRYFASRPVAGRRAKVSRRALLGILDSLESTIRRLQWNPDSTQWADYYENTNYADAALEQKKSIVAEWMTRSDPQLVWDLGANTGRFSRVASTNGISTVAFDIDPGAVEVCYRQCVKQGESDLLPLLLDLTNPSPGIGWENRERVSFLERPHPDTVLALALIHHLVIGNNVSLDKLAQFFAGFCRTLIIEFIPKSDSQVQRLLASRDDIFDDYNVVHFEKCFAEHFTIRENVPIAGSERRLYWMVRPPRMS
jgi:hypothetical protein